MTFTKIEPSPVVVEAEIESAALLQSPGVRFRSVVPNGRTPELGASVPKRGNRASRWLARLAFRLWGWRFAGGFPDVPKAIVVVVPHTTNWDFLVGVLTLFALGLRISWLGKHTLFRWPLRPLMLWLDGVPVRRDSGSGMVAKLVETMRQRETMLLAVAPEGTRRAVTGWRMGFAHVAVGADVPVVPVGFDWGRRVVVFGPAFTLSSDLADDERTLRGWFADNGLEPGAPSLDPHRYQASPSHLG